MLLVLGILTFLRVSFDMEFSGELVFCLCLILWLCLILAEFLMRFMFVEIAKQLDNGKGLGSTVADIKDANKRGALHFAAREGKTEVCKYLLEELKLDVNTTDEDGRCNVCFIILRVHYAFVFFVCIN